ncbi:MAG: ABC transporter substrate-binding protein [Chloroflexi bacterium]|nr:ABC transporter substrate-binding protein [Chloroflexota bacterium]
MFVPRRPHRTASLYRLLTALMTAFLLVPVVAACSPSPPPASPTSAPTQAAKPAATQASATQASATQASAAQTGASTASSGAGASSTAGKPAATQAPAAAKPTTAPAAAPAKPSSYKQAPQFDEQVKAGKLPPVEQRLPENPLVVPPIEEIGQYGGTWRRAFTGVADFHAYGRVVYESMLRWPRDPKDSIGPGLAEKWEFSPDGKQLTLTLRKGLKWSDGQPFTTDDILFWWNDIALNKDLSPAPPSEWVINGEPMKVEKVSNEQVRLSFAGPNGLALRMLAFHGNQWPLNFERFGFYAPAHYLKQFHPKYTPSITDYKTFNEKADDLNPERPAMTSWRVTQWSAGDRAIVASRNPYYWKVDPQGNQLPYIDEVRLDLVENSEALNLKAINGELDMQFRRVDIAKYTLLQENKQKNNYRVFRWPDANGSQVAFFVNQTYADPELRAIFRDLKFREALSYGINRKRINEVSFFGLGKERNAILIDASPFYTPDTEDKYAQFDQAKANSLLDEAGLKKGADGFRTMPNGKPLELTVETYLTSGSGFDALELVRKDWETLGLKVVLKSSQRESYWPRALNNEVQIAVWGTDRGIEPFVDPIYVFPFDNRSWMAPLYGTWFSSGGQKGEKPEGDLGKAQELFNQFKATTDPAKQIELGKQIIKLESDNLWVIGTVGAVPSIVVVKNNFRNVPENAVTDWIFMSPGNLDPAQFFFKK